MIATLSLSIYSSIMNRSRSVVAVLDIGGTKIGAALAYPMDEGEGFELAHRRSCPTPSTEGPAAILDAAADLIRPLVHQDGADLLGVASAGIVQPGDGLVTHATDALRGWAGTKVGAELNRRLGVRVAVLNDVHAHALGESTRGSGQDASALLLVAVGTGVGGGLVLNRSVYGGAHNAAGHVGHVSVPEAEGLLCSCGRFGHLEALSSGPSTLALHQRLGGTAVSTHEINLWAHRTSHADSEDPRQTEVAQETLTTAGFAVGRVLGGLANVLDPDVVVIAGGMSRCGPIWQQAVTDGFAHDAMDILASTPIRIAPDAGKTALIGAAVFAEAEADRPHEPKRAHEPGRILR